MSAATVNAQGGTWNYGVGKEYVWSYYSHNGKTHSSTAIGNYKSESGRTRPGIEAKASATVAGFHTNKTYYRVY